MEVTVKIKPVSEVVTRLGLSPGGKAQVFHTTNVLRRIQKYMPYRDGKMIKKMVIDTDVNKSKIIINLPYARYLYYGKVMEGKAPKRVTDRNLVYNKTKNRKAGSFWDRRLSRAEGKIMANELEDYVKSGRSCQ